MHLHETLISACILAGSGAGSLQIMALHLQTTLQDSQSQLLADQLSNELSNVEVSLQRSGKFLTVQNDCRQATAELLQALADRPLPSELQQQLEPLESGDGLKLVLSTRNQPLSRQRIYRPGAMGLCANPLGSTITKG